MKQKLRQKKRRKKKGVGTSITVFQPYLGKEKNYNRDSVTLVIEVLINKIEQNLKCGQYPESFDRNILWVVLDQLPLFGKGIEVSVPVYPSFSSLACVSGELWHVCFGKKGDLVFKHPEFEGKSNIDKRLEKSGIIETHKEIDGIVFLIVHLDNTKEVVAFHKCDDCLLEEFFRTFADYVNNERNENSFYYKLFEKRNSNK